MSKSDHVPASACDTTQHLAFAEASIFLMESLLLVLLERRVLPRSDLMAVVTEALETKRTFIESGIHPQIAQLASGVLKRLRNSLAAAACHDGTAVTQLK